MAKFEERRPIKCSFCGKAQEQVKRLVAGPGVYICDECITLCSEIIGEDVEELENLPELGEVPKPQEIYNISKTPVIADDSGLCLEAYNGWPGVLTHRFAGEEASDEERNNILVEKVKDTPKAAKVVCNLVYYDGTNIIVGEGILKGNITTPRGTNGFGFDPIFELESGKTLSELTSEEKNKCSARYLAALDLKEKLSKNDKY